MFTLLASICWVATLLTFGVLAKPKVEDKYGWVLLVFCVTGSTALTWMAYNA